MLNEAESISNVWDELKTHKQALQNVTIKSHFKSDMARASNFKLGLEDLRLDFSKNNMNEHTIELLVRLAQESHFEDKRAALLNGIAINTTEGRPALHMALRGSCPDHLDVDGQNVAARVAETLEKIRVFSENFEAEGHFSHIVHIGIGGSDIGPKLVCKALRHLGKKGLDVRFLSNIDPDHFHDVMEGLDAEKTLFIVASKSFTTQETLTNAKSARQWLSTHLEDKTALDSHFCAVTSKSQAAIEFGVSEDNIFDLPDWVGGRFSLWSAVGLPIALYLGFETFRALLDGAKTMDTHFLNAPLETNIPVMLALIGIWHHNVWDYPAQCILPYSERLALMPQYIQQLDMESNGKSIDIEGKPVTQNTAPIVFGASGTGAQHTFFQMLHQGTQIIPCDFIAIKTPIHPTGDHHDKLVSHVLGQTRALMDGYTHEDQPHKNFKGNRPSNTIWLNQLTPYTLGMLLALYEHKIFTQGAIWNINSFDQYGVELGKSLARKALEKIRTHT